MIQQPLMPQRPADFKLKLPPLTQTKTVTGSHSRCILFQ